MFWNSSVEPLNTTFTTITQHIKSISSLSIFTLWFEIAYKIHLITIFNIHDYVQFISTNTHSSNNHINFFYFNRVVKLWNITIPLRKTLKLFLFLVLGLFLALVLTEPPSLPVWISLLLNHFLLFLPPSIVMELNDIIKSLRTPLFVCI